MSYYFSKTLSETTFDEAIKTVTDELKKEGFGVLTEIDVKATLKEKVNVDYKKYTILGACSPHFAYEALQAEEKIGVLLPCNIIVVEQENGEIEISAVDPMASMMAVKNESLGGLAVKVREKLKSVIERL